MKIFIYLFSNCKKGLVHLHAVGIPVVTKPGIFTNRYPGRYESSPFKIYHLIPYGVTKHMKAFRSKKIARATYRIQMTLSSSDRMAWST
jgi:hypothetical protein